MSTVLLLDNKDSFVWNLAQAFQVLGEAVTVKRSDRVDTADVAAWAPKVKPGGVSNAMVMNLDFPELFLEVAGADIPEDMQGRSFVPILQGKQPADWRKSVYYHYYEFPGAHSVAKHYGVRTERHKLISFYDLDEWELFDLQTDPHELKSVYDDPAYAQVLADMKQELERLREQYQDDGSVVNFNKVR